MDYFSYMDYFSRLDQYKRDSETQEKSIQNAQL